MVVVLISSIPYKYLFQKRIPRLFLTGITVAALAVLGHGTISTRSAPCDKLDVKLRSER